MQAIYKDVNNVNQFESNTCGDMSPNLKNFKLGEASTKSKMERNIY